MSNQWDPVDVEMGRETSRRIIAILVVLTFALSIIAGFVTLWWSNEGEIADRADVALRIGAPVVAIVGTILGFYFGREADE